MNASKLLWAALAAIVIVAGSSATAQAQTRQYYSAYWQKSGGYYYRTYYYRPTPKADYRYHRVIYYPSQPRYYYYYNPYSKKYWGRYDLVKQGYSKLATEDQAEKITDIRDESFPPPGDMPAMPESEDGTKMKAPPDDGLPPDESKQLGKDEFQKMNPQMGDKEPPRQAFSGWCKQSGYYYCNYYCQPQSGGNYTCHRCIYYASQPKYVYYYNPGKGKYWGRYDLEKKGYSLLADADKAGKISDIPESAFPKPGEMPIIPGATDATRMVLPPKPVGLTDE
jgi:hypothetical protein